jgi:flagellar hook-associated protein 3 FlgL
VRITDKMIFDGANQRSGRARDSVESATREASTGVRVQHPWDDPGAAAQVISFRSGSDRMDAIGKTAQNAIGELNAADGALGEMNNVLGRARELALQFSNDTYSAQERAAAAKEVDGLLAQSLEVSNTKFGGRYLFGGFKDNVPPFDQFGAYQGDSGVRQVEVSPGQFEDASVPGDQLFGANGSGTSIFDTLKNLSTALTTNDRNGIDTAIGGLDAGVDQIVTGRAKAGASVNVLDTAVSAAQVASEANKAAASKLTDADVISSATKLAYAQRALDAALTASAKSFDLTLISKLGR